MCILYFHSFSFSTVLCCWQLGWKEERKGERKGVTVTVFVSSAIGVVVLLDHLHYLDGT